MKVIKKCICIDDFDIIGSNDFKKGETYRYYYEDGVYNRYEQPIQTIWVIFNNQALDRGYRFSYNYDSRGYYERFSDFFEDINEIRKDKLKKLNYV